MKMSPIFSLPSPIKLPKWKSLTSRRQINIGIQVFLEEGATSAKKRAVISIICIKIVHESEEFKRKAKDNDANIAVMNIKPYNRLFCDEEIISFIRRDIIL